MPLTKHLNAVAVLCRIECEGHVHAYELYGVASLVISGEITKVCNLYRMTLQVPPHCRLVGACCCRCYRDVRSVPDTSLHTKVAAPRFVAIFRKKVAQIGGTTQNSSVVVGEEE